MKKRKCLLCGKKFEPHDNKRYKNIYCCWRHGEIYRARKNYLFYKKNNLVVKPSKEKLKEYKHKDYLKNSKLHLSRKYTNDFIEKNHIIKKCQVCGKRAQVHHLEYPTRRIEIIKALLNKKIIFLCRKHHSEVHRKYKY